METIDTLFFLDDEWREVYEQYRGKEGFAAAGLKGNTHILEIVFGAE